MTLLLPTILSSSIKTSTKIMDATAYTAKYIEQDLPSKLISWLSYLFFPLIIAVLSRCHLEISGVTTIPIYLRTLLWHQDGCSIFDMLCNPEGNGRLVQYNNGSNYPLWRECLQPIPWWAQHSYLCWIRIHLSNHHETLPIKGYDLRLCMFSYYQIHPTSINKTDGGPSSEDGVTAKVSKRENSSNT